MSTAETRLYVIGDIHGRLDLLEQLIELINLDIKSREGEAVIVTLGDYVDRGPNSSGVLDRLANNPFEGRYVALKGNHEALLEAFLDNPAAVGPDWWHLGGLETVKSFGVAVTSKMRRADLERMAKQLGEAITSKQSEFLKSLKTSLVFGALLFMPCRCSTRDFIGASKRSRPVMDPRRISQQQNGFRQSCRSRPYPEARAGSLSKPNQY